MGPRLRGGDKEKAEKHARAVCFQQAAPINPRSALQYPLSPPRRWAIRAQCSYVRCHPRVGGGPSSAERTVTDLHPALIWSHRSSHFGFVRTIKLTFQCLRHFLTCFSRVIAAYMSSCVSYQTSR